MKRKLSKILSKLEHAQKDGKRNIREHIKNILRKLKVSSIGLRPRREAESSLESREWFGESQRASQLVSGHNFVRGRRCCQIGKKSKLSEAAKAARSERRIASG